MATISADRYFVNPAGAAAASTVTEDLGGGQFKATIEVPISLVFEGTSSAVMDSLSTLSNHFAAAREAILTHLTGG